SASPSPGLAIPETGEEAQGQTANFFTITPDSPLGPITVCQYNDANILVRFIQDILINQKSDQKELQNKLNDKTIFERVGRYLLITVSSAPWAFIDMAGKTDIAITEEDKNKAQSLDPFITNQCMPPFTPSSKVTSSKAGQVSPAAPPSLTSEERLRIQHKAKEHLKKVEEEIKNRLFFLQALREIENFKVSEALGYVPSESPYEENRIVSGAHVCKPGDTRNPLKDRSCQAEIFPFGLPITKYSDEGSLADLSIGISFRGESLKNIIKEVMQRETQKKIVYEELIGPDTPISSPLYNFLVTVGNQIGENQALSLLKNFFEENITICKVSGGEESVSCSAEIPFTASFEKFDWGSIYLNPTSNLSPNSCYALQVALIKDAEEDFLGTFCLGDMKKQSYLVYRVDRIKLDQKISTDYGINPMTNVIEHFRGKEEYQSEANPKRWSYFWPQEKTPQYFSGNRSLDLIGIPLLTNFHYDYASFEETRYKDEPHYFNQILLGDWEMGHFMLTPQPPFNPLDEGYFKNAKIRRLIQSSPPTIFESDPGIIEVAGFEFSDWTWEEATCETPPPRYLDIIAGGNNQDIGCKGCHYLEEKIPPPVGDDYFRWQSAKFKTKVKIDVHSPVTILEKSEEKYEWQGEQMISSTVKNNYLGIRATVSVTEVDIDHASTSCTEEALLRTLSPLTADQLDLMKRRNIKVEVIPPKILDDKRTALDSPDPFVRLKYGYQIPNTNEIESWDKSTQNLFFTKILVPSLLAQDSFGVEYYAGPSEATSARVRFLDKVFHHNFRIAELMDLHFSEERNENRPAGKKIADISEEDLLIDLLYLSEENMGNDSVESFISEEHLKFSAGYLRANPNARDALMLVHEEFRNVILGAKDQKVSLRDWSKISEIIFTKFFLWKKFFEYPRYQQNWISQFVSDVRGGIQERQATLGDRFVSRHTDDEGAFLATMNYAKDAANLTETGVWIILDSFIFAGLEGATDWGYLAHEQGKLRLDPTLGDSTLAEFMLYLEAAGAATIFMP
ncbi:MAG: hypothetical protein HYW85_06605, partial [Deltaproteobacteria bacterium]|nr:hypothetical protein [Deltaproteobacteria bacterium]